VSPPGQKAEMYQVKGLYSRTPIKNNKYLTGQHNFSEKLRRKKRKKS